MKPRIPLVLLMVAAAGGIGSLAWRERARAQIARTRRERVVAQTIAAESDRDRATSRLVAAQRAQATHRAELEKLGSAKPVVSAKPAASVPRRTNSILELIRGDPQAEVLYLESSRADLASTYGPLFRTLRLTPEVVAKFEQAYMKREAAHMDLADAARTKDDPASAAAIAKLRAESEKEYVEAQRALLGEDGYRQLHEYQQLAPWRSLVGAVAGVAAVEHVPFTAEQADALVAAIAAARRPETPGPALPGLQRSISAGIDWDVAEAAAQKILSAAQFEVMRTMDPGPTHGGLLQNRFYARVTLADEAEARKTAAPTRPKS